MISTINLAKRFVDKKLFENVSLDFGQGHTYGIIGANGAGKSTLLKILAGEMDASSGRVVVEKGKRISTLGQDHNKFDEYTVTNAVIIGDKSLFEVQYEKNAIYENPNASEADYSRAAELEELFGQMGGWNAENEAQIILAGLGIEKSQWMVKMSELRADQKVKVLLAQSLFGNPDILIMDEPTNHLDLKAIKWLEEFLINYKNLVIVVSHDSDFLDQVCTRIVDIDFGGAKLFVGNYSFWKESSALALEMQGRQNQKKEEQIKKLQEFIARFSANASKSNQATARKKALDKISLEDIKPSNRKYPYIRWDLSRSVGKDILQVENLSYTNAKGEVLFENISFVLADGDKMALLGQDDLVKTALLEVLLGLKKPTSGFYKWGLTISPAYYPSDNATYFNTDETILDWISKWPLANKQPENKDNSDSRMRSFLGRMLFRGDSVFKKASVSSGGEKARLMFARMMLQESNFLILDQPLDHLDTESIDSVIEGIVQYNSSAIFTTYNRAFIRDSANVILELKKGNSIFFRGSLVDFEKKMGY